MVRFGGEPARARQGSRAPHGPRGPAQPPRAPHGSLALTLTLMLLVLAPPAHPQTTDILTGTVTGPGGLPLEGARVEATSLETQITRARLTNAKGQYTIVFPDGGGQYQLAVHYIGMAAAQFRVVRQADEDRLVGNVQLSPVAATLARVDVRAGARQDNRPPPGSMERNLTPEMLARLPVDASDLNLIAALAPGVVGLDATDSTTASFSVAGQRPTQNQITLDGLSFAAGTVPQEALRTTRVITNSYDVARGQFTGGEVASTTRGGTNITGGMFTYSLRAPELEFYDDAGAAFGQRYTQNQLSGGLGGPLAKDKAFTFGSFALRQRVDGLPSILSANPTVNGRLGTSPDSVARFLALVQGLGIPPTTPDVPNNRSTDFVTLMDRSDFFVTETQTLTMRLDWRWSIMDGTRIAPNALPHHGGDLTSLGGGLLFSLTSHIGGNFINEARAYSSRDRRNTDPYLAVPEGRVRVASDLPDGTTGVSLLSFGGNAGLPQEASNNYVEATDELSWLPGAGGHRVKLGLLANDSRFAQSMDFNRYGAFTYASLADLQAGTPEIFARTLTPVTRDGGALNTAIYLGDTWRQKRGDGPQLTYGLRLEGSTFSGAPAFNPLVDSLFDRRTDRFPSEVHLSPRVGFSWVLGGDPQRQLPPTVLRGGVGEFRGRTPGALYSSAQGANGLAGGASQVVCIGPAVPTPDWAGYLADPSTIPTACSPNPGPPAFAGARPNVAVFDPGFGAPRSWRASLGVQRRLGQRFQLSVDALYARGVNLYGFHDLNLDETARFTLADEGGRPVFVAPASIVPATGATALFGSRLHPQLGQVIAIDSRLGSDSRQIIVGLNGFTSRGALVTTSYTFSRALDHSSFSCCSAVSGFGFAPTAGDPNTASWGTSDLERRHSFLATMTYPVKPPLMEVTLIGRLMSGARYTPMVGGDINGDGARNDQAFVFDPRTAPDSAVANGITRLLAGSPPRVRDCLTRQLGTVAARNSCLGPWVPSLDFQVNLKPAGLGLKRRLTLSLIAQNVLPGLDQLLNGSDGLHGWGQPGRPDQTLLYVRGFDPSAQRYLYEVNGRFGDAASARSVFRAPFQIAIQGRWLVGPDPVRERLRSMIGAASRGGVDSAGRPRLSFAERIAQVVPNPIDTILARSDSLHLTPEQVAKLRPIGDSLRDRNAKLGEKLQKDLLVDGPPDPASAMSRMQKAVAELRVNFDRAVAEAKAVLTEEQWAKVPEDAKVLRNRLPGAGPGPRRRPSPD